MSPLVLNFPDLNPVAFSVFGVAIYWYAIMYLLAFAMAYVLMRRRLRHEPYRSITKPSPWTTAIVEDILLYAIAGVIVGGRLGYCFFYKPAEYLANPISILYIRDGGMSFHGGAIGVVLGLAILAWRQKRPFLQLGDFLVPTVPLGLAAGRIGNFINGELWGREASADLPWAMIFPTGGDVARHPSQLYQALLEGVLLFVLLWLYARKPRYRGQVLGAFFLGYGALRFVGEFFREPDAHLGFLSLGMSMGQWLCVPMILAGAVLLSWGQMKAVSDVESPVDNEVENSDEQPPNEGDIVASGESDESADTRDHASDER
ncbi:prolipoprotein diacylglyceryl transferase [Tessaracoccus caeni]|uniref:prolipoprotein diacylglyceryl transferase n=1 Tax=Tessaracoccus caeni TaxID=3031239 RepID=UPI0023DA9CA5|nr:prolipoprotein diacylglyceryl transferase [Tessaracoccus caeni]MDF1487515.1 prolipoprotein diacylglyceryl transferase [Tessaracoccus caeni]